jgi:hypothetical protein
MDFTLSCIARQRYGDDEGMFTLVPATQYELRTEADYIALLGEATQKGLPPAAIEEILRGYFNIRYASNPDMQRAFEVIAIADTLLTTNWQQITAMRAKGEVTAWEVALHQQALSLYDKLMQDPQFRGLETVFDKAEAMREFARVNLGGEQQPAQAATLTPAQRARELAQETERGDDTQMIEGVIDLLRGIADMENRQRSAEQRLADFAREGVTVDRADFLQRVMAGSMQVVAGPSQPPTETVSDTALNGAQVQSLVQIINQVSLGIISQETAKPLIEAAFPGIDPRVVDDMLAGVKKLTPEQAQGVAVR